MTIKLISEAVQAILDEHVRKGHTIRSGLVLTRPKRRPQFTQLRRALVCAWLQHRFPRAYTHETDLKAAIRSWLYAGTQEVFDTVERTWSEPKETLFTNIMKGK